MKTTQNIQSSKQSDSRSEQPSFGKKREDPQRKPGNPLPNKPEKNNPTKPDIENDPTKIVPGVNEPEKNDPTRIVEPPVIKPDTPKEN